MNAPTQAEGAEAQAVPEIERVDELRRKLQFTINRSELDGPVDRQLREMGSAVSIKGFRPGKIPLRILRERYEPQALGQALVQHAQDRFRHLVMNDGRVLAHDPEIQIKPAERDYSVECVFDEMPQFELPDLAQIELRRPELEVSKEDLDEAIEQLRLEASKTEETGREARKGDIVGADYRLMLEGDAILNTEKTKGKMAYVELDRAESPPDMLVEAVLGKKAGEKSSTPMSFPENYFLPHLAGKEATLELDVRGVFNRVKPEIDEEFIKMLGIEEGTSAALREGMRESLVSGSRRLVDFVHRQRMLGALSGATAEFALPQSLVDSEAKGLIQTRVEGMTREKSPPAEFFTLTRERIYEQARIKVRFGLIVRAIAEANGVMPDPETARQFFAQAMPEEAAENMKRYRQDPQYAALINGVLAESAVFGIVASKSKVEEEKLPVSALREEGKSYG